MKNSTWSFLVFVITFAVVFFFKIPFFWFILVVMPLMVIILTMASFEMSFGKPVELEPVPEKEKKRVADLEALLPRAAEFNFAKIDAFYARLVPDSITYAFKHREYPMFLCVYHFGVKMTYDIVTIFENDYGLTTCNNFESGNSPRPEKQFLQVFQDFKFAEMADVHMQGVRFLESKGLRPSTMTTGLFRRSFLDAIADYPKRIKKIPLWPVMLVYWVITKRGKMYAMPIEQQFEKGMAKL